MLFYLSPAPEDTDSCFHLCVKHCKSAAVSASLVKLSDIRKSIKINACEPHCGFHLITVPSLGDAFDLTSGESEHMRCQSMQSGPMKHVIHLLMVGRNVLLMRLNVMPNL
jgi:hypothetical protein